MPVPSGRGFVLRPLPPSALHHAATAPRSAVAELGVVRRSLPAVLRITPAMANSETNITSGLSGYVSDALRSSDLLGFAHADTLAAMRCLSPVCPSARLSVRVCASLSLSSARRLRTPSVRAPVCLPGVLPPAPRPHFVPHPPLHQHGPPHAAGCSAAPACMRRLVATRRGWRESERTPNHALQRTGVAVTARASAAALPPAMHGPRPPRPSLSLGSLGVIATFPPK